MLGDLGQTCSNCGGPLIVLALVAFAELPLTVLEAKAFTQHPKILMLAMDSEGLPMLIKDGAAKCTIQVDVIGIGIN